MAHLNDDRKGERLRNGVRAVIIGEPNAGKSSLINSLSNNLKNIYYLTLSFIYQIKGKRPVAIVSPIEGTTRDIIENSLNISGYPVVISDTAGLRDTSEIIEIEGVKRAFER